jgi:hypothetical protein
MFSRVVLLILCATAANSSDNVFKCNDKLHCLQHQIIKFFDEIDKEPSVNILNNETVLKKVNNSDKTMKTEGVLERSIRFLNDRVLKVHLQPSHGNSENGNLIIDRYCDRTLVITLSLRILRLYTQQFIQNMI